MKPTAWLHQPRRAGRWWTRPRCSRRSRAAGSAARCSTSSTASPCPPTIPSGHFDNVVVTPHISGPSTPREIGPIFDDNLRRYSPTARSATRSTAPSATKGVPPIPSPLRGEGRVRGGGGSGPLALLLRDAASGRSRGAAGRTARRCRRRPRPPPTIGSPCRLNEVLSTAPTPVRRSNSRITAWYSGFHDALQDLRPRGGVLGMDARRPARPAPPARVGMASIM